MVSGGTMASDAHRIGRDDGIRVVRGGRLRRELWGVAVLAIGLAVGWVVLRSGEPPAAAPSVPPRAPASSGQPAADARGADASNASAPAIPTTMPRTRAGKLRALRTLGVAPTRNADGKRQLDAGPVIDALNRAGIHDGIAAFPPPGTDPPRGGVIVPDEWELPEGYVRHHQTTDDGQPLPPILMFHPDYTFTDEQGNPVAIPPDRVVPPELVPPGFPVRMLEIPPRDPSR
jgi:hypothetical protein